MGYLLGEGRGSSENLDMCIVCIHSFICACVHACVSEWVCVCVCLHAFKHYVCMYVRMYVCKHACMHACMYVCIMYLYIVKVMFYVFISNFQNL